MKDPKGYIHSIQTLGTLDGPGVRFVLFVEGCNLRCGCCHNPDTWERTGGKIHTAAELAAIHGITPEELIRVTAENAKRVFRLD